MLFSSLFVSHRSELLQERELEKVNVFYVQKEAEVGHRVTNLPLALT